MNYVRMFTIDVADDDNGGYIDCEVRTTLPLPAEAYEVIGELAEAVESANRKLQGIFVSHPMPDTSSEANQP